MRRSGSEFTVWSGAAGRIVVLSALAVSLLASVAWARVDPLGPAVRVNAEPIGEDENSVGSVRVLALGSGGFVVTWDVWNRLAKVTFARHFDPGGEPVGAEFPLPTYRGLTAAGDDLILSLDVGVTVAGELQTVLTRFTADGVPGDSSPVQVLNTNGGFIEAAALTATPQGDVIQVWGTPTQIFGQRFDADLQPIAPSFEIASPCTQGGGVVNETGVASTPEGGFIVAWWNEAYGEIWARVVDPYDTPLSDSLVVGWANYAAQAVCGDRSGDVVVALGGRFRRYAAHGQPGSEILYTGVGPSLACLPDGSVVMIGPHAYSRNLVIGRVFDADNRPHGQLAAPGSDFSPDPAVTALADEALAVAWTQCNGFYTECDIFAQRFALVPGLDCSGDCNGDGQVTIDELLRAVDIALREGPDEVRQWTSWCPAIDTDLDSRIAITEIVAAVNRALEGCE